MTPNKPRPAVSTREKRAAAEARIRAHLTRLNDPDLTRDVYALVHLLNVENARWRHRVKTITQEPTR
ncbi:hypothetical protein [Microbacterium sp. Leaf151]|uniref:hypothetical protein n=1 Tax=Microbacterium sp. Leaf151 TaxID=1736276 RepID=UPI0006FFB416|nr:hypothetical protein [Microbacterium sp. Leaf151]KQR23177.1 hypothetical protein ASF76_08095 [Microbacterium sp. Leaf151]